MSYSRRAFLQRCAGLAAAAGISVSPLLAQGEEPPRPPRDRMMALRGVIAASESRAGRAQLSWPGGSVLAVLGVASRGHTFWAPVLGEQVLVPGGRLDIETSPGVRVYLDWQEVPDA